MGSIFHFILLFLALTSGINATAPPSSFIHSNLHRIIDLSSPVVREVTSFVLQKAPEAKSSGKEYFFAINGEKAENHLAYIFASDKEKTVYTVRKDIFDSKRNLQYYKVLLGKELNDDDKLTISVRCIYSRLVEPLPKAVGQLEPQKLLYKGDMLFNSPYLTEKQKTTIRLPSSDVESYTPHKLASKDDNKIVYGMFSEKGSYTVEPLRVHYTIHSPPLAVKSFRRDIEISQLGANLAIEEYYDLENFGAGLRQPFNRVEHQASQFMRHSFSFAHSLSLNFPAGASDPYFRDSNGNVSTSNFRSERKRSVFEFKTRFPLFGGWKYSWTHGYNLPLSDYLYTTKDESDSYVLQVPFVKALANATIDEAEIRVILPEGATDIKVHLPFEVDRQTEGLVHSYLDTKGKPTISLFLKNVVDEHQKLFQVSYKWNDRYRKPTVLIFAFLGMFFISMVCVRLDLTIKA